MKRLENKNLPAFPISEEQADRLEEGVDIYYGLTKREYFAAKAMQGYAGGKYTGQSGMPHEVIASWSVGMADALLSALANEC